MDARQITIARPEANMDPLDLIPRPPVIRELLARNIHEARFLRALLRLSIQAAEERRKRECVCVNTTKAIPASPARE